MPKENRLRKPKDFRRAYTKGERIKGRFMTAFIVPSETPFQRLGVTASKKVIGNSVSRSRAKRLLREAFRLSSLELGTLRLKYDWALNSRGMILEVGLEPVLEEFREIVGKVHAEEMNRESERLVN